MINPVDRFLLDKIRSLFRKAEEGSGATEAERDSALAAAHRLMRKYRLEEHQLGHDDPNVSRALGRDLGWFSFSEYWQVRLLEALGEHAVTLQVVWYPAIAKSRIQVIGTEVAIDYALLVLNWVKPQLMRECEVACWNARQEYSGVHPIYETFEPWTAGTSIRFRRTFYDGAVGRITARLREWAKAEPVGQAIVRSDRARIDEWLQSQGMTLEKFGRKGAADHPGARDAGAEAGDRADLRPGNKVPNRRGARELTQ